MKTNYVIIGAHLPMKGMNIIVNGSIFLKIGERQKFERFFRKLCATLFYVHVCRRYLSKSALKCQTNKVSHPHLFAFNYFFCLSLECSLRARTRTTFDFILLTSHTSTSSSHIS